MKRIHWQIAALLLAAAIIPFRAQLRTLMRGVLYGDSTRMYTVSERMKQYGPTASARIRPHFQRAQVAYPSAKLVFVGLKRDSELQVYAAGRNQPLRFIRSYPILAASGVLGPKLREGDGQVPEGVYRIDALNPNSSYHLALHVNYPNALDQQMAKRDGRDKLGGDIMIHGSNCSIGCLAMGDEAAEDLFVMAADTGIANIEVILSPFDLRTEPMSKMGGLPEWSDGLYAQIKERLVRLPSPPADRLGTMKKSQRRKQR